MRKRKDILAVLLAAAMTAGTVYPAFAGELTDNSLSFYEESEDVLTQGAADIQEENTKEDPEEKTDTIPETDTEISSDVLVDGTDTLTPEAPETGAPDKEEGTKPETPDKEEANREEVVPEKDDKGNITGVFIKKYEGDKLLTTFYWNAADQTWSYVEGDTKTYLVAGPQKLMGETEWNIVISDETTGATKASGGYVLNISAQGGSWGYYLEEKDTAGIEVQELPVYTKDVPANFFTGAKAADQSKHSGLFQENEKNLYYLEKDGSIVMNDTRIVENIKYHFGADGKCDKKEEIQESGWVKKEDGYYWLKEDGTILTESGWKELDGKKYFLEEGGRRAEGWKEIEEQRYYFVPETGQMKRGWSTIDGKKYYFEKDGHQTIGWRSLGGKKYYFVPKTGQMKRGWSTIDGKKYYFEKDGSQTYGWRSIGGKMYYFAEKTGVLRKGWLTLGNKKYYLNKDGSRFSGIRSVGGKKYYFQKNGELLTNEKCYEIDGKFYNIDKDGVMKEVPKVKALATKVLDKEGWNLEEAFEWASELKYDSREIELADGVKEADYLAIYGFENAKGNSFVMASTFYQMAKLLGYDVHYVKGKIQYKSGKLVSHGWCEIDEDGKTYVCDPYFAHEGGKNGLMFEYGDRGTWIYKNHYRVN